MIISTGSGSTPEHSACPCNHDSMGTKVPGLLMKCIHSLYFWVFMHTVLWERALLLFGFFHSAFIYKIHARCSGPFFSCWNHCLAWVLTVDLLVGNRVFQTRLMSNVHVSFSDYDTILLDTLLDSLCCSQIFSNVTTKCVHQKRTSTSIKQIEN